eukprot:SAG31_NODE_4424_length_3246_cov_1.533524_3_plen_226_part_00
MLAFAAIPGRPEGGNDSHSTRSADAAAALARAADQMCPSTQVETALRSVGLSPDVAATVGHELVDLGFASVLDLQLLAGGLEAEELMGQLKDSGLRIGDRTKLRLLVGDHSHLLRVAGLQLEDSSQRLRRAQEASTTADDDGGLSLDTIAIIASITIGAVGYFVQVSTHTPMHVLFPSVQAASCNSPAVQHIWSVPTTQHLQVTFALCRPTLQDERRKLGDSKTQ